MAGQAGTDIQSLDQKLKEQGRYGVEAEQRRLGREKVGRQGQKTIFDQRMAENAAARQRTLDRLELFKAQRSAIANGQAIPMSASTGTSTGSGKPNEKFVKANNAYNPSTTTTGGSTPSSTPKNPATTKSEAQGSSSGGNKTQNNYKPTSNGSTGTGSGTSGGNSSTTPSQTGGNKGGQAVKEGEQAVKNAVKEGEAVAKGGFKLGTGSKIALGGAALGGLGLLAYNHFRNKDK